MDEHRLRSLLSQEGTAALAHASAMLGGGADSVRANARLRANGFSAELAAAAVAQARLRARAEAKFGEFAEQMLFTEDGLQQATRLSVAGLHADRYRAAGMRTVADLGCGIGSDAIALSALGVSVSAVEADAVTAAIAAYNLAPFPETTVRHGMAEDEDLADADGAFCDPARRVGAPGQTRRTFRHEEFSPRLDWVFGLANRLPIGVKLGPGHPHEAIPRGCTAQWVSVNGSAVELGLWFGPLAGDDSRYSALVIGRNGAARIDGDENAAALETGPLERWILDPDPAVIRAKALGGLAKALQAHAISDGIAYLTTDQDTTTPFAQRFEVIEELPLDRKRIRAALRARGVGILEIKKRGADVDPDRLRRELSLRGSEEATLILTRIGGRHRAILAARVRGRQV